MRYCPRFSPAKPSVSLLELTKNPLVLSPLPFSDTPYDGLHPKLVWHRTKTLGRGGDCCDFCLKLAGK